MELPPDNKTAHIPEVSRAARRSDSGIAPFEHISTWLGRYFSSSRYLAGTLIFYFIYGLLMWCWLAIDLNWDWKRAATIAYDVGTGGLPLAYVNELQKQFPLLWGCILAFHVLSWLVVPVLAAAAINAVFREQEARRAQATRNLRKFLRDCGAKKLQLSGAELEDFIESIIEEIEGLNRRKPAAFIKD